MPEVEYISFLVGESVRTVVATDLTARDARFVERFDPDYYTTVSSALLRSFSDCNDSHVDQKNRLAGGIMSNYGQAIETFFAILFAVFQAPACPLPWLLRYSRSDLISLIEKVNKNDHFDLFRVHPKGSAWDGIAATITDVRGTEGITRQAVIKNFAAFWRHLAKEYVDERYSSEYNSIKHGARIELGGFNLSIGRDRSDMSPLGGSPYGMTTQRRVELADTPRKHRSEIFGLRETHFNWDPPRLVARTGLIRDSIINVIQFIRGLRAGSLSQVEFEFNADPDAFRDAGVRSIGVGVLDLDTTISFDDSFIPEKDTIFNSYKKNKIVFLTDQDTH